MLRNYDILRQNGRASYIVNGFDNVKKLEKLIELQDVDSFQNWLSSLKSQGTNTINFSNSSIAQFDNNSNVTESINTASTKSEDLETKEKALPQKIWHLITENKLISGIVLLLIVLAFRIMFGIELK